MPRTCLALAFLPALATAQQPSPGLRLLQVVNTNETHLVDTQSVLVHRWPGALPGLSAHLMPDGSLLRAARSRQFTATGVTGAVQRVAFDGALLWDWRCEGPTQVAHHDVHPMPNGNALVLVWDVKTTADAIAAGRDPALITGTDFLPDAIVEVQPTGPTGGTIVWEWHLWDHLIQDFDATKANFGVVADHPELVDVNYPRVVLGNGDWNHCNGVDYDPVNDWIVVSAREQCEVWVIDHSTTTEEAAGRTGGRRGRGGDLLWRWGNPAAYQRGTAAEQQLFFQHDPRFVLPGRPGEGHLTVFNNSWQPLQSAVFELELPLLPDGSFAPLPPGAVCGPARPVWTFTVDTFVSQLMSSAERLPNGNTLICSAQQLMVFEVNDAGQGCWIYISPSPQPVFQCDYVDRQLWSSAVELSASAGGRVAFDHMVGSGPSPRFYLLLGSTSGTSPGTTLGGAHLPLNPDYLTSAMALGFNQGPFVDTIGDLDGSGHARSELVLAPWQVPAALAGVPMDFAHVAFDGALQPRGASNPVRVTIVP
jgi:hypothetical protein